MSQSEKKNRRGSGQENVPELPVFPVGVDRAVPCGPSDEPKRPVVSGWPPVYTDEDLRRLKSLF